MKETPYQERYLSARGSTIHVRLINNKQQSIRRISPQPRTGVLPYFFLARTEQHILQHRIVRNENIRTKLLHLKSGNQLSIIVARYVTSTTDPLKEPAHIHLCRNFPLSRQLLKEVLLLLCFGKENFRQGIGEFAILRFLWFFPRIRRTSCVHTKTRPPPICSTGVTKKRQELPLRISH